MRKKRRNELIATCADLLANDICIDGMTVTLKRSFPCFDMEVVTVDERAVDVQENAVNVVEDICHHQFLVIASRRALLLAQ